ncbi:methyltransferase family protein [Melghirimyces profundicolus]|uniref:Methyltransferase family protein n=1 Tax=Melghirimyces profundicolus TaxID=1242148 RepID=A0A2T6AXF0_9BACL|nr:methyltransferase domain-containing protein [Melghirimyces profundicolus]PTX48495.1 methyltransferase family protein [Melghirimyces profundicolus]
MDATDSTKGWVRDQFQRSASGYRDSAIHSRGQDLQWIGEEVARSSTPLLALDIATGTGHTAFVLSGFCHRVVGLDLTPGMLKVAAEEAEKRGLQNLTWSLADAEDIPFPDRLFDVATCRIAPHHFPRPDRVFSEIHRVLVSRGRLILVDNTAPDDPDSDRILNEVERLRDPSHHRVYPVDEWTRLLQSAGFSAISHVRSWETPVRWKEWMDRARTPDESRKKAMDLLSRSPVPVRKTLGFDPSEDDPVLILRKSMWICRK